MNFRRVFAATCVVVGVAGHAGLAHSALITITGTNFDVTYNDASLGLFSAPTLVGDTLFFTFNSFIAESLNGAELVTTNSTISGIVLSAKGAYEFGALDIAEFGDYKLNGVGSTVSVTGQWRAFNVASSLLTQTTNNLSLSPLTPLTLNDGALHDWTASARIDSTTAPSAVPPLFGIATNVILSKPRDIGVTIENQLSAYTDPNSPSSLKQAFIEKKFAGVQMTITPPSPVPLPPAAGLLAAGFAALMSLSRRRSQTK